MCHGYVALLGSDDQVSSFMIPACDNTLGSIMKKCFVSYLTGSKKLVGFSDIFLIFGYPMNVVLNETFFPFRAGVGT